MAVLLDKVDLTEAALIVAMLLMTVFALSERSANALMGLVEHAALPVEFVPPR